MKKLVLLILCLTFFGCKKTPLNYRNKFLGKYSFFVHEKSFNPVTGPKDTNYYFEGEIKYGKDKNTILIPFPSLDLQIIIYEDGTLEGYHGKGEFSSINKIKYSWIYFSPSAHTNFELSGEKK